MPAEPTDEGQGPHRRADAMAGFMRLWLTLMLSYAVLTFVFDLAVHGWIDLDWLLSPWPFVLPLGQAALFKLLARLWRTAPP